MYLSDEPTLGRLPRPPRPPGMRHGRGKKHGHRVKRFLVPHDFPHELSRTQMDDYYYDEQQLGGLGKKLKKFVKKVAAPIAHIGAAVLTGGASLALSANILKAQQQRKAAEAQAKQQAEVDKAAIAAQEKVALANAQANVAPAAAQTALTPSIAPPAGLVQQAMGVPTMIPTAASFAPSGSQSYEPLPSAGDKPAWLMPAAIGGAGLLALILLRPKQ